MTYTAYAQGKGIKHIHCTRADDLAAVSGRLRRYRTWTRRDGFQE